jgi:ribonuclease HII
MEVQPVAKKDKEPVDLWELQRQYAAQGYRTICGVDEAGRGPLAGPVCAAAVILPENFEIPSLNDSKQLTDKKRRELYPVIMSEAISYGIAFVDEGIIDRDNILNATFRAMGAAIRQLYVKPDLALIDGNRVSDFGVEAIPIVKGDARVASIAAASILAKVARDQYMEAIDAVYPEYGFAIHKGYGTKRHYAALTEYGMCPIHRRTFLKKFYGQQS